MGLCLQCKKWVTQPPGKRKKEFCNDTCRSNYRHAKNRKKAAKASISAPIIREAKKEVVQKEREDWAVEIDQADDVADLERIARQIDRSSLSGADKRWLTAYGQQVYQNKFGY